LIVAHKDIDRCNPAPPDWFCDWHFYSRSEKDLVNLVKDSLIDGYKINLDREKSNKIIFLVINKL
jgi:hypothetical protein